MNNPFEVIEKRLSSIESLILDLKHQPTKVEPTENPEQWNDLNWLIQYDPEKRTKPTWYSKISRNEVPYYKRGKKVYFLKSEIDEWLKQGKCKSNVEIEKEAEAYLSDKKRGLK
jgi:excisionase family DNA binding protein